MSEEGAQDNAVDQPEPETNGNRKKSFRPIWLSDTTASYICLGFATLCWTLGAALLNGHPKPLLAGWGLIYLGIVLFGAVTYFGLRVHRKKQKINKMPEWMPMAFLVGIAVIGLVVSAFAVLQERPDIKPPTQPKRSPSFVWSLKISGSSYPDVLLTNDCLLVRSFEKTGDLPNGAESLTVITPAFVLIPVQEGESNKVFTLTVENHAQIIVKDPQFMLGVPAQWDIGIDSQKWVSCDGGFIMYRRMEAVSKFMPSNMQYFAASKPMTLFSFDTIKLPPITNLYPLQYIGDSLRGGLIEVSIRVPELNSEDYEESLSANVFFAPATSNFFKPLVGCCKISPEGKLIWPNEKQIGALQK